VSEQFITDTARYADILLPATMQAEQYDLAVTWGHLYVMLNQPAISPPGECVPNIEHVPPGSQRPWASTTTTGA